MFAAVPKAATESRRGIDLFSGQNIPASASPAMAAPAINAIRAQKYSGARIIKPTIAGITDIGSIHRQSLWLNNFQAKAG